MNEQWFTIERVRENDKWLEFWFLERTNGTYCEGCCHDSCKAYMFLGLIDDLELADHVLNHGVKGMKLQWGDDRPTAIKKPDIV